MTIKMPPMLLLQFLLLAGAVAAAATAAETAAAAATDGGGGGRHSCDQLHARSERLTHLTFWHLQQQAPGARIATRKDHDASAAAVVVVVVIMARFLVDVGERGQWQP